MKRVVLTGSESVGKTTLAAQLARHYGALMVPEFSRAFANDHNGTVTLRDVPIIAAKHVAAEHEAVATALERGDGIIILDTDLVSTVVYSDHYFGECPAPVRETAVARRGDYYLLLDIDVPWVADGVRDRSDRRAEMHAQFMAAVQRMHVPYAIIEGTWSKRFQQAVVEIDRLLATT